MVYDEPNLFTGQRVQQNPPFAETINNTPSGGVPLSFSAPWSNGAAAASPQALPAAGRSNIHAAFYKGTQYIVLPTKFHSPYSLQYTASVQQQFGRGWQAQITT
jgi:hypothetical protein